MAEHTVEMGGRDVWHVTPALRVEVDPQYPGKVLISAGRDGGTKAVINVSDVETLREALDAAMERVTDVREFDGPLTSHGSDGTYADNH